MQNIALKNNVAKTGVIIIIYNFLNSLINMADWLFCKIIFSNTKSKVNLMKILIKLEVVFWDTVSISPEIFLRKMP